MSWLIKIKYGPRVSQEDLDKAIGIGVPIQVYEDIMLVRDVDTYKGAIATVTLWAQKQNYEIYKMEDKTI